MSDQMENSDLERSGESQDAHNFLIVGLGASAGGINALQQFFEHVPSSSGMAYVVILHLSPDYDSKLSNVLQAVTPMQVVKVIERTKIQPDTVYVIPPDKSLKMVDGYLTVTPVHTIEERRAPVDIFFRTLADSHHTRAVAVVLSGTGANGSMGIKRIKENGGAAFVQNPREAEFNEMPRNSIATGLIDAVLGAADIPAKIMAYNGSRNSVHIPLELVTPSEDHQEALLNIFTHLRISTGHDFTNYKRPTILRRIERRLNVHNLPDLPSYASFVKENPDEVKALLKDLLISVTNFFRDKEAFAYLESDIIPRLLERKGPDDKVRVWIVGCATGEEAYSVAMLFAEKTFNLSDVPMVQIFATDIDDAALAQARAGVYTLNDAADVTPERLHRFFEKHEHGYQVRKEIREMILFVNHNVIKDPPFSRLDLVTCRNMLIYLNQTAQLRVMETLHFALNPGRYLFIGPSESVESAAELYVPVSKEFHIYQTRPVLTRSIPVPDLVTSFKFERPQITETALLKEKKAAERMTYIELHQQLLESYAPPSVVVNQEYDLVHLSERAGRYLHHSGGEPSKNLLKLIKPELRLELRSGLYEASQKNTNLDLKNLKVKMNEGMESVNILIRPVLHPTDATRGYILVIFEKTDEAPDPSISESDIVPDRIAHKLEEELIRSKAQLRGSIEQYEIQAEELKASNEELQAMNEELRSSAEELETSKEELESINEELTTVNQELKVKIAELSHSNSNFQNLINSTDIGTIFLDRSFRVSMFTPAAQHIFNLIVHDIGRPLSDISSRLVDVNIAEDAERVLDKLQPIEREVRTNDNRVYIMRILPYRTPEDRISGVIVTFVNITERKNAEMELRESEDHLRLLLDSVTDYAIMSFDNDLKITAWNIGATRIFGYAPQEIIGKKVEMLFTPEDLANGEFEKEMKSIRETGKSENERWHLRKDGSRFFASEIVNSMKEGKRGYVKIARDMTANKLIEQHKDEFIAIASHELRTPVTSIKAYSELIIEMLGEDDQSNVQNLASKLGLQVNRLTQLVSDLLDTTRLTSGHLSLSKIELDVNEVIKECRESLEEVTATHLVRVQTGDVPHIYADKQRILQVLTNLVSNAIKYSPKGSEVTISTERQDGSVLISVEDSGIGISADSQKMLFEKFSRAGNETINSLPGIGLGLYITSQIVKMHGGTITVDSKEGRGSRFTLSLPVPVKREKPAAQ
jgi:two-component system, chemotaxis family, CheB/CheR fusion protein